MPRTLQIEDTPLIENGAQLLVSDGRHELDGELAGAKIHVEVRDGKVVGFEAERNGEQVETFVLQETTNPAGAELMPSEVNCYLCACSGSSCTCRPYPCPGGH